MASEACTPAHIVWLRDQGSVRALTGGEEAEFTALVERQARFAFRVAYAVLLNSHDAEDAAQETFLKLYRNGGWRHAKNERAFLARVAWRVAVDARRRSSPASGPAASPLDLGSAPEPPSPLPGPEDLLLSANQHAVVHSMIDKLPEELRLPLVLSSFDELNSREIAGILGIPEGTVRTRLQRARQLLRQKLTAFQKTPIQEVPHA
ncbi:MAG: RNA polymerase sigma factor [Terracidiphilus sp.]